ncbi:hypothetical protein, partial [Frankia sp. CiP1_Cm_nod2]|uniref:hypothetical protein n=1 Tax=Frankia sp. CiP1_Cm_nod2 TaxID=2897161 RepID=UPI002024D85F
MIGASLLSCALFGRVSVHSDKLALIFFGGWRPSTCAAVREDTYGYTTGALGRSFGQAVSAVRSAVRVVPP